MIKNILFVMLGGSIGAALRYIVGLLCNRWFSTLQPVGTFIVNLLGCFLLGILMGMGEKYTHFNSQVYLMLTVGLCGAFTTFSTFSADTFRLMDNGQWGTALFYLVASIGIGFLLFYFGKKLIL